MTEVNWNMVADDGTLPSMRATCTMKSWKSDKTSTERLMYRVGWMVEDPEQYRGMFINDNLIVGAGPDSEEAAKMIFDTTQNDSRRMKTMLTALQVHLDSDPEKCLKSAEGGKCVVFITEPTERDVAAGYDRNKVRNYYKLGSVDIGVIDGAAKGPSGPVAMPPAPPPAGGLPRPPAGPGA